MFYFKKLYEKFRAMNGWKNKLFSVIKGPGWMPGSPWTGFIDEIPEVITTIFNFTPRIYIYIF